MLRYILFPNNFLLKFVNAAALADSIDRYSNPYDLGFVNNLDTSLALNLLFLKLGTTVLFLTQK